MEGPTQGLDRLAVFFDSVDTKVADLVIQYFSMKGTQNLNDEYWHLENLQKKLY